MSVGVTWHPVGRDLASLVDAIYVVRSDGPAYDGLAGSLLPQCVWTLEGRFSWRSPKGAETPRAAAVAMGPSTGACGFLMRGPTTVVGAGLFPEGWAALMPLPAHALTDAGCDLRDLWGAEAGLPLRLDPEVYDAGLARSLEAVLLHRLQRSARAQDPRTSAIAAWADRGGANVAGLAAQLGVSHRQLDRLSLGAFGMGPRRLANKHRTLRAAVSLAIGDGAAPQDVWSAGWSDQPHFIRSFRHFVGVTPGAFARDDADMFVRRVMRARVEIASRHALGLAVR